MKNLRIWDFKIIKIQMNKIFTVDFKYDLFRVSSLDSIQSESD